MTGKRSPAAWVELALHALIIAAVTVVGLVLGIRAALRLEDRWDTFHYHIPFAALRGGLGVPYTLDDRMARFYEGFPPLPHFVQGVLWRLTGSINATGVINYIAFAAMIAACHARLGKRGHLVALIALTTPLVLIHTTVSYVDLFGNAFLALGIGVVLHRAWAAADVSRGTLAVAIAALVAAAWSKFMLVPIVGVALVAHAVIEWRMHWLDARAKRRGLVLITAGALVAAAPYVDNLISYGNPFWPVRLPIPGLADAVPYAIDIRQQATPYRPPPLAHLSDFQLFWHSLFEIDHPTSYAKRARWIIDQGEAWISFRMGGFWVVHVVVCCISLAASALLVDRRRGAGLIASVLLLTGLVSILPRAHDLRYYMFLPLVWAIVIADLHRPLAERHRWVANAVLAVHLAMFVYVLPVNRSHLEIERYDYTTSMRNSVAPEWWKQMTPGETYCAVRFAPVAFLLTGPTLSEHTIIARTRRDLCPANATIIEQFP